MNELNAPTSVLDAATRDRAAQWLRRAGARLPSLAELADPSNMPQSRPAAIRCVDPDRPDPANLFRVHWYNDRSRTGFAATPPHFVLLPELTGVRSPIGQTALSRAGSNRPVTRWGIRQPYVDRQLLPWRHSDFPHPRLPRDRGITGRHGCSARLFLSDDRRAQGVGGLRLRASSRPSSRSVRGAAWRRLSLHRGRPGHWRRATT
jgi:hypothetical protein